MTEYLHDLAAPYALDALDPEERAVFERHLESCADCRAEVASLQEPVARLAVDDLPPPDALRSRVLSSAAATPQDEGGAAGPRPADPGRYWKWVGGAAAVITVLLLLSAGAVILTSGTDPTVEDILAAPDAQTVELAGPAADRARFVFSPDLGRGVFAAEGLAAIAADETYQLWLIGDDGPRSAGLFVPVDGDAELGVEADFAGTTNIGVTVEPQGGSPAPTGEIGLIGDVA